MDALSALLSFGSFLPALAPDLAQESGRASVAGLSSTVLPIHQVEPDELALERGLEFLAKAQARTGTGALPCTRGKNHAPVGVSALAALAWIGGGSSLTRGPYQAQLALAIDYLLDHQLLDGKESGYITDTDDQRSKTHGHGLATLALTQAWTQSPNTPIGARLEGAIRSAVRRIESSQGVDGGWFYDPRPTTEQEGSVTVCLLWALRGARNAGIVVDSGVVERAIEYVKSLQAENGGFQYSHSQTTPSIALTAASLSTLHATGVYTGPVVAQGYDYLWRELGVREQDGAAAKPALFPYYERMYLAQALWQHRDINVYRSWARSEADRLLRTQLPDGSWEDRREGSSGASEQDRFGKAYATAINCLVLGVPRGTLPIFTR